jgi:hypothetical protein
VQFYVISHQMKFKKTTYMQFYIGIAIADIGPYNLWLLPVTVKFFLISFVIGLNAFFPEFIYV